jgi:hypothetical protein
MNEAVSDMLRFNVIGSRPVRPDGVDTVTGRARFGADLNLPGQLIGRVLRSPHPHAYLRSIDTSAAAKVEGVKAIATRDDFSDQPSELTAAGEMMLNYRDIVRNVLAREKVLYEGHAVAAVAATSARAAREALRLIRVEYEVLPHVVDVSEAMKPTAPILNDRLVTAGAPTLSTGRTNIAKHAQFGHGDIEAGFARADVVIEQEFRTAAVHQGYIEPHACVANVAEDGQAELWVSTQGHWIVRAHCARLLGWDVNRLKVSAAEIGGGFGGKTVVYLEPLALLLSAKARRPVKMVKSREEVMKASGPASPTVMKVRIGATRDGRITAAWGEFSYGAGAFAGSPAHNGAMCAFAPYDLENVRTVSNDVLLNRPKVAAYRAPGAAAGRSRSAAAGLGRGGAVANSPNKRLMQIRVATHDVMPAPSHRPGHFRRGLAGQAAAAARLRAAERQADGGADNPAGQLAADLRIGRPPGFGGERPRAGLAVADEMQPMIEVDGRFAVEAGWRGRAHRVSPFMRRVAFMAASAADHGGGATHPLSRAAAFSSRSCRVALRRAVAGW